MKGLILPLILILVVGSAIVPIPAPALDGLIVANFLLSLFLLVGSFSLSDPIQFSTLPAILLLSVVARLLVTISTTRAILSDGNAGAIVAAFGSIMVNDDLLVGAILFVIISIIQFVVISKGSERVAEVSARFALDALPGRQMSLDADLRAGLIDPITAQQRRQELQIESRLYGALDGAMKFIKGDTIATFCVTIVNLLGGIISGTVRDELPLGDALSTYTVLSIGDGLVGQLPSLLTCVAAGILVTRVPRGDNASAEADILAQLGSFSKARWITAIGALLLACVPGMPTLTCLLVGLPLALPSVFSKSAAPRGEKATPSFAPTPLSLISVLITVGRGSIPVSASQIVEGIDRIRQVIFDKRGIVLPPFSLSLVSALDDIPTQLRAEIQGATVLTISAYPRGEDPVMTFEEKLTDILLQELPTLLDDTMTRALIDLHQSQVSEHISLLIPAQLSISQLTQLLRDLIAEDVSVKSFDRLIQTISEKLPQIGPGRPLLEEARISLRRSIVEQFVLSPTKPIFLGVSPNIESMIIHAERTGGLPPLSVATALSELRLREGDAQIISGIVVSRGARALVRDIIRHSGGSLPVFARDELVGVSYLVTEIVELAEDDLFDSRRDQMEDRSGPQNLGINYITAN